MSSHLQHKAPTVNKLGCSLSTNIWSAFVILQLVSSDRPVKAGAQRSCWMCFTLRPAHRPGCVCVVPSALLGWRRAGTLESSSLLSPLEAGMSCFIHAPRKGWCWLLGKGAKPKGATSPQRWCFASEALLLFALGRGSTCLPWRKLPSTSPLLSEHKH